MTGVLAAAEAGRAGGEPVAPHLGRLAAEARELDDAALRELAAGTS